MHLISSLAFLTFAACVPVCAASAAATAVPAPAGATLIVLDASGSMRERIKGETKMEIAQRAVRELVESLPASARLGLAVYSHRKLNDCADIELLIPPAPLDKPAFVAAVNAIKPNGRTPLSAAVEFAANALDYTKQPASVILVSDGLETCGKDPCATVARLEAAGVGLSVHAVAFDRTTTATSSRSSRKERRMDNLSAAHRRVADRPQQSLLRMRPVRARCAT